LFYADAAFESGASLLLNTEYEKCGIYLLEGDIDMHDQSFEPDRLLVFSSGDEMTKNSGLLAMFAVLTTYRYDHWMAV
jgi:redox-sensitive bicupin YhaK (pirin superfamily)